MKEIIIALIGLLGGAGVTLISLLLNRHWSKEDKAEAKEDKTDVNTEAIERIENRQREMTATLDILVRAQKVSMAYDINCIARTCIHTKQIPLEVKKTIVEMHDAYEALPSKNGLVMDTIMDEVKKLQVVTE